jgi:hypothetical protein
MMRDFGLRVRRLTLAAFLVALLVPVVAATAHADEGTCANPQTFTFVAALPGSVIGLPGNPIGVITTHECFSGSTSTGTFAITVSSQTIATGTLFAVHSTCSVAAWFEGEIITGHDFSGTLHFNPCSTPPSGSTTVTIEDVGTATATFYCTAAGCAPVSVSFVPVTEDG